VLTYIQYVALRFSPLLAGRAPRRAGSVRFFNTLLVAFG
jgi:hypothetical protein